MAGFYARTARRLDTERNYVFDMNFILVTAIRGLAVGALAAAHHGSRNVYIWADTESAATDLLGTCYCLNV